MHHILFLPEITFNIFEFLNPFLSGPEGSHKPNPLRLRDLAAVAITCHALSGPALDVLWDTQMCFGRLLMCMPPSVVEIRDSDFEVDKDQRIRFFNEAFLRRSIHLIQDPSPSDMLRMLPYARRIKRIGPPVADFRWLFPEHFLIPSKTINWLLSAYPMEKFLPHLTHMSCPELVEGTGDIMDISFAPLSRSNLTMFDFSVTFDDEVEGLPLLSILVNDLPQLRTIKLKVIGSAWHNIHTLYSGAIAPLCLFRNLEHLNLTIVGLVSEGPGLAGLHVFPCLQELKLSSDTNFAVDFLIALKSNMLHTLDLIIMYSPSAGNQLERLDQHRLFSSLRRLTISSDFYFMMSLIEAVHSNVLESLCLTLALTFGKRIVRSLTTLILSKRGWESSLRTITMDRFGPNLGLDGLPGPSHLYSLSIENLLVFSHLQRVILDDLAISLNDALCKKLAIGWPDLVEFYVRPQAVDSGAVGPDSLVTFARHCPKLSFLQLGNLLNTTTEFPVLDDETLTALSSRPTRSTCMRISVHADSSPTNPKAVAKFLAMVFPDREIKIILAASFCRKSLRKSSDVWNEVVEWLRRSQLSSLEFGPCYHTQLCTVCWVGR